MLSESEAEFDGLDNQVEVKEENKGSHKSNDSKTESTKSAIRLSEIGPRLKLKLVKIQEGVCDGEILYHDIIKKSPEELKILRESHKLKK